MYLILFSWVTSENEQERRSVEHFNEVLNRATPPEEPNIHEINIKILEIILRIISLKKDKAPGNDNLNAELFKLDTN